VGAGGSGGGGQIAILTYVNAYTNTGTIFVGNGSLVVITSVPEPSPLLLAAFGAFGALVYRLRRSQRS
jgi:hypothetical protein